MAKKETKKKTQDQMDADKAAADSLAPSTKSKGFDWQLAILLFASLACALAFLPTTLILFFGLMPTFAALVIDPTPDRIKTMAVGAMNMAGIVPFLLTLWTGGEAQSVKAAFSLVAQPATLITMYSAAVGGYIIFYTVSSLVATVMLQRGRARLEEVIKRIAELERKWGREVTGAASVEEFPEEDYFDASNNGSLPNN